MGYLAAPYGFVDRRGRDPEPFSDTEDRALAYGRILGNRIIQSQREARFREARPAFHQQIELPPALRVPLPLALQKTQPLGSENQPRMLRVNSKFLVLRGSAQGRRHNASNHDKACNPIPNCQKPIVSH